MQRLRKHWLRIGTHIAALLPFALLVLDWTQNNLTANPIQAITQRTGKTGLIILVLSLVVTPLNIVFGLKQLVPLRRPLGLYAFFYVSLHLLTFVYLDYGLDFAFIWQELAEKRYVLVGFTAFLLLLPLAITSTKGSMKLLGKRWKLLHKLVYLAAPLAVLHYLWLVKADIREPLLYGGLVAGLLALRIPAIKRGISAWRARRRQPSTKPVISVSSPIQD